MAIRLNEEEVHQACAEIASQGERPTSLNLLEKLGRGSLTTITKYLNSWNKTDDAQAIEAESLPAVVQLPSELSKEGEDLLKKMWNVAKTLTDTELDIQREALKQAEIANQQKVEEAFKFSEAQSMKIERLEEDFVSMKNQLDQEFTSHKQTLSKLNDAEKVNVGLSKDNEQLLQEIKALKDQIATLESTHKTACKENKALEKQYSELIKHKDLEIRSLDIQIHKHQASLDSTIKTNNELTLNINSKSTKLESCLIDLEKTGVRLEIVESELNAFKNELKTANKSVRQSEKQVARLEGQLAVYQTIDSLKKVK